MAAQCKTFEIRDEGTHMPALAIKPDAEHDRDRYCFARGGYGTSYAGQREYVILHRLSDRETQYDPHGWQSSRTMLTVHQHIIDEWHNLESGQVLDVRFILGETDKPCESENAGREQQPSSVPR